MTGLSMYNEDMLPNPAPYIPGYPPRRPEPLSRFLPPIPEGVLPTWLENHLPPGSWVLDPFVASPRLAVEAARAGYRLLVAANNPVGRFLLEMAAAPPSRAELRAALAELAAAHRGEERIEPHIRSLYNTECATCGNTISAEAFLWERGASAPYARIYQCPFCNDEGEHPVTNADLERAAHFAAGGPHHARALERVASVNDPDRIYAEEAISAYLPRAVYALFTLINRLDGLQISPGRRKYLHALLLTACDQGNKLWAYPTERKRPRQLENIPSHFRENNIWLALEHSIELWGVGGTDPTGYSIPLVIWPEQPPESGGISLFEGRLKELVTSLETTPIQAVCTAFPRTNQAFWTLSALWAGWLWGREATRAFKVVLHRRRYGWDWHTTALYSALNHLWATLPPGAPFFGLIGEVEAGFITAALTAMDAVGFELENIALRLDSEQAQIIWKLEQGIPPETASFLDKIAGEAAVHFLNQRGQPASYLSTYIAALTGIIQKRRFRSISLKLTDAEEETSEGQQPHYWIAQVNSATRLALTYRSGFLRFGSGDKPSSDEESEKSSESGLFWLQDESSAQTPLADRVEIALVNYLLKHPDCTSQEIDSALCLAFPGLLTPEQELIHVCLDSYGECEQQVDERWNLRPQDKPAERRKDLDSALDMLIQLGERLGFLPGTAWSPSDGSKMCVVWSDVFNQPQYRFYPIASAVLGEIILQDELSPGKHMILLPGGRANLVAYKLKQDPRLARLCQPQEGKWHFLKFRHLRWLFDNPLVSRENLDEQFALDPLTYTTPQLRLL